jgi:hypothetical protein
MLGILLLLDFIPTQLALKEVKSIGSLEAMRALLYLGRAGNLL